MHIAVLGGDVIGLSTGIELLERGQQVSLYTQALPPHGVSSVAAAIWMPFLSGNPARLTPEAVAAMRRWSEDAWARLQGAIAGLRPYRPMGPRLETEEIGGRRIVHNYGHGGSGVTFSWGCAMHAADLVAV